jgi:outer membrane protein assembly factor BamB
MLVELDGVRQIVNFDGVGLWGYVPESGAKLWFYQFDGGSGGDPGRVNVAQPLLLEGNRVFITASYGRGCAMLRIEQQDGRWQARRLWPDSDGGNLELRSKFTSPVLHEGFIYGLDEGIMVCLDPETGERRWKRGRFGHGQLLLTNGQILVLSEYGELVLVDPDPDGLREITRLEALPGEKTWNPPALVRGRALVRNHMEMACFNLEAE